MLELLLVKRLSCCTTFLVLGSIRYVRIVLALLCGVVIRSLSRIAIYNRAVRSLLVTVEVVTRISCMLFRR